MKHTKQSARLYTDAEAEERRRQIREGYKNNLYNLEHTEKLLSELDRRTVPAPVETRAQRHQASGPNPEALAELSDRYLWWLTQREMERRAQQENQKEAPS